MKLKIRKVNGDLVFLVPAESVSGLGWKAGDVCECRCDLDGIRIVRTETKHDRAMQIADEVMDEYRSI
jgi:bifunctional DNA-binding transcriptional regulator/antitoxin component of YhaV-PrlF toxin-antitoxin module